MAIKSKSAHTLLLTELKKGFVWPTVRTEWHPPSGAYIEQIVWCQVLSITSKNVRWCYVRRRGPKEFEPSSTAQVTSKTSLLHLPKRCTEDALRSILHRNKRMFLADRIKQWQHADLMRCPESILDSVLLLLSLGAKL